MFAQAGDGQCEVVLVGCGAPLRGMGWYHAVQMLHNKCPAAKLCYIVEPWFLGPGKWQRLFLCSQAWDFKPVRIAGTRHGQAIWALSIRLLFPKLPKLQFFGGSILNFTFDPFTTID